MSYHIVDIQRKKGTINTVYHPPLNNFTSSRRNAEFRELRRGVLLSLDNCHVN